jgi:hypothetical protein
MSIPQNSNEKFLKLYKVSYKESKEQYMKLLCQEMPIF